MSPGLLSGRVGRVVAAEPPSSPPLCRLSLSRAASACTCTFTFTFTTHGAASPHRIHRSSLPPCPLLFGPATHKEPRAPRDHQRLVPCVARAVPCSKGRHEAGASGSCPLPA